MIDMIHDLRCVVIEAKDRATADELIADDYLQNENHSR
jgi:hypothetical protein